MTGDEVQILVVEDNAGDAELIVHVLRKHNLADQLVVLADGAEALDYLFGQGVYAGRSVLKPRMILLDLKLPKVDGLEVLRRIKADERTKLIPVVVLTSSALEQDLREAYALGANSYISKPIKYEEFSKMVADVGLYWMLLNRLPAQ